MQQLSRQWDRRFSTQAVLYNRCVIYQSYRPRLLDGTDHHVFFNKNQNRILKEMIVDVLLIVPAHPELATLAMNVAGLMISCLIPAELVKQIPRATRGVDYYDSFVRFMISRKIRLCVDIYELFAGLGVSLCTQRLEEEDIRLTMCHYL